MLVREQVPLAPYTTLGIGGPARWFVEGTDEESVLEAVRFARERSLPLFVLGGGSNLLVSDEGFPGVVVRIALMGIEQNGNVFRVAAGENWDNFVTHAIDKGFGGIECLAGIPGTAGGTPVQNVGAYGQEVSSVIERVRCYDREARAFVELGAAECGFSYRRSRFNGADRRRFIVTRVDYRLTPGGAPTLRYAELERAVEAEGRQRRDGRAPAPAEVAAVVRRIRRSKGMVIVEGDPDCRSAGSFFKNPVVNEERFQEIAARGVAPPKFPAGVANEGKVKIPAAWLIEQAGFHKGYALGAAGISSKHTLALVNEGGAKAVEILALAERIREAVAERFGIRLEMEPELVGFQGGKSEFS